MPALRAVLMDYSQLSALLASSDDASEPPTPGSARPPQVDADLRGLPAVTGSGTSRLRHPGCCRARCLAARAADERRPRGSAYELLAIELPGRRVGPDEARRGGPGLDRCRARPGRGASAPRIKVILGSLFRSVDPHAAVDRPVPAGDAACRPAPRRCSATGWAPRAAPMLSVYGSLFLTGAMAASRAGRPSYHAGVSSRKPRRLRSRLGARRQLTCWTAFGPTNVAIHRVNTAMELGDVQIALDLGPGAGYLRAANRTSGPARAGGCPRLQCAQPAGMRGWPWFWTPSGWHPSKYAITASAASWCSPGCASSGGRPSLELAGLAVRLRADLLPYSGSGDRPHRRIRHAPDRRRAHCSPTATASCSSGRPTETAGTSPAATPRSASHPLRPAIAS